MISATEKAFICEGCAAGIRFDGRDVLDFRHLVLENSVFPHVNGSSRVRVADGVDVLCSVKVEVGEPLAHAPLLGLFDVDVDISPSCNLKADDRRLMDHGAHVAQQLQRFVVASDALDLAALCIVPGKYCWVFCVDVLVLAADGDPLDACSVAMYVALNCTKIPKVELFVGESGVLEDFEVCGDLGEALSLDAAKVGV